MFRMVQVYVACPKFANNYLNVYYDTHSLTRSYICLIIKIMGMLVYFPRKTCVFLQAIFVPANIKLGKHIA